MTKVLYISYDGMTDALGQSQVIPYLSGLSSRGFRIHILSFEKPHIYRERKEEVKKTLKESGIEWSPLKFSSKIPVCSKLYDLYNLIRTSRRLHKQNSFNIIHCRSYLAAYAGIRIKNSFNIPVLFDMRGFWLDERVEGNIWNRENPIIRYTFRFLKKREKILFKKSDAIISLTREGERILNHEYGEGVSSKVSIIPCCVDLAHFSYEKISREQREQLRHELDIRKNEFIISYAGSLGTWYLADEMLKFFRRLLLENPLSRFLFITNEEPGKVICMAKRHMIDTEKILIRKAGRDQMPTLLSLSDLSVFFIKPVFSKKGSSPVKLAELMGMGIPFITNKDIGDTDKLVEESGTGILVEGFSDEDFDRAIGKIPQLVSTDRRIIRAWAERHFSLEDGIDKYYSIYTSLLTGKR